MIFKKYIIFIIKYNFNFSVVWLLRMLSIWLKQCKMLLLIQKENLIDLDLENINKNKFIKSLLIIFYKFYL